MPTQMEEMLIKMCNIGGTRSNVNVAQHPVKTKKGKRFILQSTSITIHQHRAMLKAKRTFIYHPLYYLMLPKLTLKAELILFFFLILALKAELTLLKF